MNIPEIKLKLQPYPYQREGIEFGLKHKRILIGDEPGLGKTLQSIGIVNTAQAYPCLVICPSSLKINWQREFEKFSDARCLILSNENRTSWSYLLKMRMWDVAIVNYESLRRFFVWDIRTAEKPFRLRDVVFCDGVRVFKSIIIDECHRVKDPSAQQTIFTRGIVDAVPMRIMLSGTPVVNRPDDLLAQLSILGRLGEFGGASKFRADFCAEKGKEPAVPLSELSKQLYSTCLIRREKAKVLPQLPDKTRVELIVDIDNRDEYLLAQTDLAEYLRQYTDCTEGEIRRKMRMEALVKFGNLRRLATIGKIGNAVDFIGNFLASGKQLILFCALHDVVDALRKAFPEALSITGRDNAVTRQAAVDSFQAGHCKLVICSIKAAGVGLTLTASSTVAFLEIPWTYADCCQCEDRAHRIGQKDNVTCYYLLGNGTIDRVIYGLVNTKKAVANEIMNSDDDIPTDEKYFDEIVNALIHTANGS